MAAVTSASYSRSQARGQLASEWRVLGIAAGIVAVITAPAAFAVLHVHDRLSVLGSLALTVLGVILTRAIVELVLRRLIPTPTVEGNDPESLAEDALVRRRLWFWSRRVRLL